ncbi:peptidase associated/transthyretin-like domain-containing protein [Polluticaenibacter yanchengensis]|uniref:Carboxypeptidase-like regulatory domain-containing protein n=1 Tax=Polluticaenibacter yanchengensis TaxID=3014562 RepID=A0ABT4UP25_9BACT|nr:hypothetical protein [Chitinophagaceae bacterium LY-5]
MKRLYIFAFIILCISQVGLAQNKVFKGTVIDSATQKPLANTTILLVTKGVSSSTNMNGSFAVEAGVGSLLAFIKDGYYSDTVSIKIENILDSSYTFRLKPLHGTLEDVTITSDKYSKYQQDSLARRTYFLRTVGENKIPVISQANNLGFGVAINIDHFTKREKTKRAARSLFEILEEDAYINSRWNEQVVAGYTSLAGDELITFMAEYRPSYKWLRKNTADDDILYYVNGKLSKFKKKKP